MLLDAIVFPSAHTNRRAIAKALKKSGATEVNVEGVCIVCKVHDLEALRGNSEIEWFAQATMVARKFSSVTAAIVQEGIKAILPGEKFYVRAIQITKADYVERDVEFASTGALVEKLAGIRALPARNEQEAARVLVAVIGKKSAYTCIKGKT